MDSSTPFHFLDAEDVVKQLNSNVATGLSPAEASQRIDLYGPNELPAGKSASALERLWEQINSVLIYVLLIGAALSFGFNHYADAFAILGVIIINVWLGFIMEGKAENSTKKLKGLMSLRALVLRSGEKLSIHSNELTTGDIFFVQSGDIIPADARVLQSASFQVLEAILTGEAHAISKRPEKVPAREPSSDIPLAERTCMVYSGTQVLKGTATCITTAIGKNCEIGKIHDLVRSVETVKTPLVLQLEKLGRIISVIILAIAGIALLAAMLRGHSVQEAFSFAIGIAVAAIPEGLPSCVTITFSIGVYFMAQRKALVKSLPAVETLGSVSVICSDKTGTLTLNQMTVQALATATDMYKVQLDGKVTATSSEGGNDRIPASKVLSLLTAGFFCNDTTIRVIQNFVEKADSKRGAVVRDNSKRGFSIQNDEFPDPADLELGAIDVVRRRSTTVERLVEEYQVEGDPTESCIYHLLLRHFNPNQLKDWIKENPRIDEIPFDSSTKYMATLHNLHLDPNERKHLFGDLEIVSGKNQAEELVVFLKGAPEKIFQFCSSNFTEEDKIIWKERQQAFGSQGMRVLGLAYKRISSREEFKTIPDVTDFNLSCLVGIMDPPRPEAIDAIKCAQQAGITVKMITGDHPSTALAIGKQLGLQNNPTRDSDNEMTSITGTQLDALLQQNDESGFDEIVIANDIFARTTPEHKLRIVQSLQRQNLVCSMTGDGVNDCPALKAANIGVAMGITGTEVAKDAGKMILLDDNFATIVDAIRMGRCTYQNLVKILTFVLPTNSAQAFSIVFALIIGVEVPIIAVQILWVNMITSITLGLVLAFEPVEERIMQFPPRSPDKEIFGRFLIRRIIFITILFVACIYLNILWEREEIERAVSSIREIRTIAVNTLSFCQIGYLMSCRSLKAPVTSFSKSFFENKVIYIGIILVIFFQMLFTYAPFMQSVFETEGMDALAWGKIVFFMFVAFIFTEIEKFIYFNYFYLPTHQHSLGHVHHPHHQQLLNYEEKKEEKKQQEKDKEAEGDYLDNVL